jgi:predicted dehydrogenase
MGVVGAGSLGFHHVRILREMDGIEFQGFHESRPERAAQVASELGVRSYASLGALLDDVDAITVAVTTSAHHQVALAALQRGIACLVEKPLAANLQEADDLVRAAAASGTVLQTGHVERFNRAVRAALPFVDGPRFIQSDRLAPFSPRGADVAVVLDLMIHDLDLVNTFVASSVAEVSAIGVPVLTPFVDIANARLVYHSGAVANITASRVSRQRMRKLRIFQRNGYMSLDLAEGSGEFYELRGDVDLARVAREPAGLESFVTIHRLDAPEGEPLRLEFANFIAAVSGHAPPAVSGEDGRNALDLAMRIVGEIRDNSAELTGARAAARA